MPKYTIAIEQVKNGFFVTVGEMGFNQQGQPAKTQEHEIAKDLGELKKVIDRVFGNVKVVSASVMPVKQGQA